MPFTCTTASRRKLGEDSWEFGINKGGEHHGGYHRLALIGKQVGLGMLSGLPSATWPKKL